MVKTLTVRRLLEPRHQPAHAASQMPVAEHEQGTPMPGDDFAHDQLRGVGVPVQGGFLRLLDPDAVDADHARTTAGWPLLDAAHEIPVDRRIPEQDAQPARRRERLR